MIGFLLPIAAGAFAGTALHFFQEEEYRLALAFGSLAVLCFLPSLCRVAGL